jgi:NADPH:quinone reductase-like Zn-dependent oxidoreductase
MNAAVLHAFGQPLQLRRIPIPHLRPGHVLVRVEASGVNPLDTKIQAGFAGHARTEPPAVLGIDLAGNVESVADDVTAFTPDDRVYGKWLSISHRAPNRPGSDRSAVQHPGQQQNSSPVSVDSVRWAVQSRKPKLGAQSPCSYGVCRLPDTLFVQVSGLRRCFGAPMVAPPRR